MPFVATTTVSVLSGSTTDEWGYEQDGDTVSQTGIPMAITEKRRTVVDPSSSQPTTVRWFVGRCRPNAVIAENNRLRDERTGYIYIINQVTYGTSLAQTHDLVLDLTRV